MFAYSYLFTWLWIYACMASATFLEWETASTTVFAPLTASPEANTPGRLVWPFSSARSKPRGLAFNPLVVRVMVFCGPWEMDTITLSAGTRASLPSTSVREPSSLSIRSRKITPSSVISMGFLL